MRPISDVRAMSAFPPTPVERMQRGELQKRANCRNKIFANDPINRDHRQRSERWLKQINSRQREIARFFACAQKSDRAFNIDPPASSYAIMRRATERRVHQCRDVGIGFKLWLGCFRFGLWLGCLASALGSGALVSDLGSALASS